MIKVPKNAFSMPLQSPSTFRMRHVGPKLHRVNKNLVQQLLILKQNCLRLPDSNRFGDWSVFINLRQSRLSIVSQIYTSVLKTKVKLIEYAFETLPAWALSMPPSKARKYNQIRNNVGGKVRASHNWLNTRYQARMPCRYFPYSSTVRVSILSC